MVLARDVAACAALLLGALGSGVAAAQAPDFDGAALLDEQGDPFAGSEGAFDAAAPGDAPAEDPAQVQDASAAAGASDPVRPVPGLAAVAGLAALGCMALLMRRR